MVKKEKNKERDSLKSKKNNLFNNTALVAVLFVGIFIAGGIIGFLIPHDSPSQPLSPNGSGKEINGNNTCLPVEHPQGVMDKAQVGSKVKYFLENSDSIFAQNSLKDNNMSVKVTSVEDFGTDFYKVSFDVLKDGKKQGSLQAYTLKDGESILFSEPHDLNELIVYTAPPTPTPSEALKCENMEKKDNTELTAFVVSYCPFGIQTQRIISVLPEDLREHVKVRYIGAISNGKITSMHGDKEAQENLRQICIREEQPDRYWPYISCFIKAGKGEDCLSETKVDTNKLSACISDPERGLKFAGEDFKLQNQLGVGGSPTLILNGSVVDEVASAQALEKTMRSVAHMQSLICCSSSTDLNGCSAKVPAESAARSFSETYSEGGATSGSGAQCN